MLNEKRKELEKKREEKKRKKKSFWLRNKDL
jgi:hypothetical protein